MFDPGRFKSIEKEFYVVPHNAIKTIEYKYILLNRKQWINDLEREYDELYLSDYDFFILLGKEREFQIQCKYYIPDDTIKFYDEVLQGKKFLNKNMTSNTVKIKITGP